ncbi:Gfo/Idh/MocA family protein [Indiicoccus explosivorum]|uniref:Gfo/Idh/MocA family protein n=1 Tax=Indiicoccus explosivorum TaxID=1917864 RepID=UPI000B44A689|nr:Gfo/Idh/MocA family oxidoreductase [Indiicoccus explosivorum]
MKKAVVIGGGNVAETVHVPYYQERAEIDLAAVVGRDAGRTEAFARKNRIPRFYTDADEMFAAEKPDLVSVCTPNRFHFELVMKALEHGCDVLCEKPPAMSAGEALQMHQAAEAAGAVLAYNFHHRFADDVRILKEKIAEGMLGDVYVTKIQATRRSGIPGWGYFNDKEMQGGGPLMDLGIHMLDAALYALGFPEVRRVTAKMYQKIGRKKSSGSFGTWDPEAFTVEDSFFAFIELKNDGLLQLETSFALNMKEDAVMNVSFYGDEAGAELFPAHIHTDSDGKLVSLYQKEKADTDRHRKSMEAFVDKCLGHDVMIVDSGQGYTIQKIVEALYQSAEKGECISL